MAQTVKRPALGKPGASGTVDQQNDSARNSTVTVRKQAIRPRKPTEDWRAQSAGHWRSIGELYLEILTKLHAQRGLPPPPAAAILQMRADARRRAEEMFGE